MHFDCSFCLSCHSRKYQIAARFSSEHGVSSGRRILWVLADSPESFIRDYKQLYPELVGTAVPTNFTLSQTLRRVKRALEERHSEWFLVLQDAHVSIRETNSNLTGHALINYLPTCGQTLVTTSAIVVRTEPELKVDCGFELPNSDLIRVDVME